MQHLSIERQPRSRVIAVFESSVFSFELSPAATLEDLAGRLADFNRKHDGALIRVDVRLRLPFADLDPQEGPSCAPWML